MEHDCPRNAPGHRLCLAQFVSIPCAFVEEPISALGKAGKDSVIVTDLIAQPDAYL